MLRVTLGLLFAGCASFPLQTRPPLTPPDDAEWVTGAGGVRLYTATALPGRPAVGVVSFVLGPEITAAPPYPRLTAALTAAGFATAVLHPRGTGYSDGARGDLPDYQQLLDDQQLGLAQVRARFPSTPIFLFGHSAGAALALEQAAAAPLTPAGVVLVNPAYRIITSEAAGPSFGDYVAYAANMVFRPRR